MTTIRNLAFCLFLAAALAFGQATVSTQNLAASMTAGTDIITLTTATGVYTQGMNNQVLTGLFIDHEYMEITDNVNPLGTGTQFHVRRYGSNGSVRSAHSLNATVYFGPPGAFDNGPSDLIGTCSTTAIRPNYRTGNISRCVGGVWQHGLQVSNGSMPFTAFPTLASPVAGTNVADVNGTIWFSQLNVPENATLTGACVLNGGTVGTDKWIVALYDAAGALVANSATAGVTTAGASAYQCIAFTASAYVVGPATYYVALQGNGTTDNFKAYGTGAAPSNYGANSQTGTFGTLAAITPTTTFTASKGPQMVVY